MAVEQLSKGVDDGAICFQTGQKGGFYGMTTVITRPAITASQTATATTTINERRLDSIQVALVNLGLITTDG